MTAPHKPTHAHVATLQEEVEFLKSELERAQRIIQLLKRDKFGASSERFIEPNPDQLVFNEIEVESARLPEPDEMERITYDRKKGRGTRKPFPENLPREERIIDLQDNEKFCPHDGTPLVEKGQQVCEKLKAKPAEYSVVVEIRKQYACPACESHWKCPQLLCRAVWGTHRLLR